jgi:hypothetical protein
VEQLAAVAEMGFGWTPARGLHARRVAALRLPPLQCGCRDPELDCTCQQLPLTEGDLAAWAGAAAFLLHHGTPPILPAQVIRQLWWRGVTDRLLMAWLRDQIAKGGEVA